MRYRVKGERLIITGSLIDYGVLSLLTFNRRIYERRCQIDQLVMEEWKSRGKPKDLSWIAEFEKKEVKLLEVKT